MPIHRSLCVLDRKIRETASKRSSEFIINGRFLSVTPTGVHRVAREMLRALDRVVGEHSRYAAFKFIVAAPPRVLDVPPINNVRVVRVGHLTGQFWEQISLPLFVGRRRLLNFCNLGPLVRPGIVIIHDAQAFISPESYSKAFAAYYRTMQPLIASRAEKIITVSNFSRDMLARYGVAPKDKIAVIHNGGDHILRAIPDRDFHAKLGLQERLYAVALANPQKHKNVGILLRAFADPRLRNATLVLVGQGERKDFSEQGFTVPPNVVFAGRVSDESLRSLLESAACLAFPSTTEGFGLPPLEAMTLGCPVIAAPRGALPEIFGSAAVYADPADHIAWATAIAAFIGLSSEQRDPGCKLRDRSSLYAWERSALKLLDLLAH